MAEGLTLVKDGAPDDELAARRALREGYTSPWQTAPFPNDGIPLYTREEVEAALFLAQAPDALADAVLGFLSPEPPVAAV